MLTCQAKTMNTTSRSAIIACANAKPSSEAVLCIHEDRGNRANTTNSVIIAHLANASKALKLPPVPQLL